MSALHTTPRSSDLTTVPDCIVGCIVLDPHNPVPETRPFAIRSFFNIPHRDGTPALLPAIIMLASLQQGVGTTSPPCPWACSVLLSLSLSVPAARDLEAKSVDPHTLCHRVYWSP